MSAQACFLPVPKGEEASFNVAIYNYQTTPGDPAILALTATSQGTSAQIVDEAGFHGQRLFFNKNGERASFLGQRLSDNRKERGEATTGKMTKTEKQQNMVMIIQVPLAQKRPAPVDDCLTNEECEGGGCWDDCDGESDEEADVEDAIIKIGESEGVFREIGDLDISRDPRFPVRVTLQFYKATANGVVDTESMETIAKQLDNSKKYADEIGSLVVSGNTNRATETISSLAPKVPSWWPVFWLKYGPNYPQHTEEAAQAILFRGGRFYTCKMQDVQSKLLDILGSSKPIVPVGGQGPLQVPDNWNWRDDEWNGEEE